MGRIGEKLSLMAALHGYSGCIDSATYHGSIPRRSHPVSAFQYLTLRRPSPFDMEIKNAPKSVSLQMSFRNYKE
jgi:hypothetical protein